MDIQRIEQYLSNGDPYTFIMLAVSSEALMMGKTDYQTVEEALVYLRNLLRKKFGSGMIILPFEGDMFLAFAPFVLSKNFVMGVLDSIQQEYFDFICSGYPGKEAAVSTGCIIGVKRSDLEELCYKAEKLIDCIKKQGKWGYKIIENR